MGQGAHAGAKQPGTVPSMVTWRPRTPENLRVLQGTCSSGSLSKRPDGQVSLLKCLPSGVGFSFAQVPGVCAHGADYLPISSPAWCFLPPSLPFAGFALCVMLISWLWEVSDLSPHCLLGWQHIALCPFTGCTPVPQETLEIPAPSDHLAAPWEHRQVWRELSVI